MSEGVLHSLDERAYLVFFFFWCSLKIAKLGVATGLRAYDSEARQDSIWMKGPGLKIPIEYSVMKKISCRITLLQVLRIRMRFVDGSTAIRKGIGSQGEK